jgi:hypothetical protein
MGLQKLLGADNGLGKVEEYAVHAGMRFEDSGEQPAMTSADVGDAADAGEIQCLYDRAGLGEGLAREISGEDVAAAKVLVPPRPHIGAEYMLEGGFAIPQSVEKVRPGLPILLDHDCDLLAEARRRA